MTATDLALATKMSIHDVRTGLQILVNGLTGDGKHSLIQMEGCPPEGVFSRAPDAPEHLPPGMDRRAVAVWRALR